MKHYFHSILLGMALAVFSPAAMAQQPQPRASLKLHPSQTIGKLRKAGRPSILLNDEVNRSDNQAGGLPQVFKRFQRNVGGILRRAPRPRRVVADGTVLQGFVINSTDLTTGYYRFQAAHTPSFGVVTTAPARANGGGALIGDTLYVANFTYYASFNYLYGDLYAYNVNTGERLRTVTDLFLRRASLISLDNDQDPTTGKVYGCTYANNLEGYQLSELDYANGKSTAIARLDSAYVGMAFDAQGQLYGISQGGYLCKVDKATAASTVVGFTGVVPGASVQSADIDLNSGKMYWTAADTTNTTHLYEINLATAKASLVYDMPGNEQIAMLNVPASDTKAGAPSIAEGLAIKFDGTSLTGTVSFKVPTVTFNDQPLTGSVNYTIYDGDNIVKNGTAAAGAEVSEEVTVAGGMTTIKVVLSNGEGESKTASASQWTGYDQGVAPVVTMTADGATAHISWTKVAQSVHGGAFNAAEVTYDVMRLPDSVVVATGLTDTTYTDQISADAGLKVYRYAVAAVNHGVRGLYGFSGGAAIGTAIQVPYRETFDTQDNFDVFTSVDGGNQGVSWRWEDATSSRTPYTAVESPDSWMTNNDVYLVTPPIHLEGGRFYKLTIVARPSAGYNSLQSLEVKIGQGGIPDASTLKNQYTTIWPRFDLPYNDENFYWISHEKTFSVKADGDYRIAFHDVSDHEGDRTEMREFSVTFGPEALSPDSVTALKATAGAQGALTATVSFTAPATTLNGTAITAMDSINVYSGDSLVGKVTNASSGQTYTVTDSHAKHGSNTYRVVAYNAHGEGMVAQTSVFVGVDVPVYPQNITLRADGEKPVLTWTAPTEGANGGYVDPTTLTYNIYTLNLIDNSAVASPYKKGITATTFTVDSTFATQQMLYYAVTANNAVGESDYGVSNQVVVGPVEKLPYHESFAGGTLSTYWYLTENNSEMGLGDGYQDDDGGDLLWMGQADDAYGYFNTGNISLEGAANPHLIFYYYCNPKSPVTLDVVAIKPDLTETTLQHIDMRRMGLEGWLPVNIDLSSLKNEQYIQLSFRFAGHDTENATGIDNVSIFDQKANDLAVTLQTPDEVTAGKKAGYVVTVSNRGTQTAGTYTVKLLADGKTVAEQAATSLSTYSKETYTFQYAAPSNLAGKTTAVSATVDYASDENLDDNTTARQQVAVKASQLPGVGSVTVTGTRPSTITWTKPNAKNAAITDDVESYMAWQTTGIGDWTTVEGDGATHYTVSGITLLHNSPTTAFEVFSLKASEADTTQTEYKMLVPHSGDKAFLAMSGADGYYPNADMQHDNDYLISPELSGEAQTASFYLHSLNDDGIDFEIMYSTATADTADFKVLESHVNDSLVNTQWRQYSFTLPVGTKYFAIHKLGSDQFGMMVDDLSFEPALGDIKGYNVYCNGTLVASVNGEGTLTYLDNTVREDSKLSYGVSVVYATGESAVVYAEDIATGINEIVSDTKPVDVYTTDGKLVGRQLRSLRSLQPGVYVVNGHKVVVK